VANLVRDRQLLELAKMEAARFANAPGQANSPVAKPYPLAMAMLDVVCEYDPPDREANLRKAGLDDPALLKSAKDPKAVEHYMDTVELLINVTKNI
jgi:hypothetical protein